MKPRKRRSAKKNAGGKSKKPRIASFIAARRSALARLQIDTASSAKVAPDLVPITLSEVNARTGEVVKDLMTVHILRDDVDAYSLGMGAMYQEGERAEHFEKSYIRRRNEKIIRLHERGRTRGEIALDLKHEYPNLTANNVKQILHREKQRGN